MEEVLSAVANGTRQVHGDDVVRVPLEEELLAEVKSAQSVNVSLATGRHSAS